MSTHYVRVFSFLGGLGLAVAALTFMQQPGMAQTSPVSIVAGAPTGNARKCIARPESGMGWVLRPCDASPSETFDFPGSGHMKLTTTNDCVGVATSAPAALKAGAPLTRVDCDTKSGVLLTWKDLPPGKISLTGSPKDGLCLNGDLNAGTLSLGDCQSSTLVSFFNLSRWLALHVHDSKGKDTGNCLANPGTPGTGWSAQRCDVNATAQHFIFDTSGMGSLIANFRGNSWDCVVAPASWNIGAPVMRQTGCWIVRGQPAPATPATTWRWTQGTQLVGTQSPNSSRCLTLDANKGAGLFVGDCTKPATLTAWDVSFTSF